jgi:phospholipase/carboxylesterase
MTALLSATEINSAIEPIGSIIWLHGLGADGQDFVPIVPELYLPDTLPLRFIFPDAPMMAVTINNGHVMRAWYDIVSMTIDQHADQAGIERSIKQISELIQREEERGIPSNRIILAGFSQGAVIALTAMLTFPKKLAGALALSGYLPHAEKVMNLSTSINFDTPIFLGHGIDDVIVPHFLGEQAYHQLAKLHYPISSHSYPMGHSVCQEEIQDIASWIKNVYKSSER